MIYKLFPKFHVRYEGFSFYGPRKSDEGADTYLMYNFFSGLIIRSFSVDSHRTLQVASVIDIGER